MKKKIHKGALVPRCRVWLMGPNGLIFGDGRAKLLEAIKETVPVYEGKVRIFQDVTISPFYEETEMEISATLSYQACDDRICYPPAKVPLRFVLEVGGNDSQRVPEHLQHKGK